ncbi:Ig-like domain-containing protein [Blastococcus brunescens]|uniref:Ig-like domain-containing protein n=1 Tax=Blastococcus brunescens TaxID=1564165 RepID=A0ABZ1B964_9ACTN|nr:Ig-like domain-containing protein [Blastococcus sp. BMG 8361]WRL67274.1 Ig-like domain-containing protein [Blastococcus sp. BMG 8361]
MIDIAPNVNNASGSKDPVTGETGLVILAVAQSQSRYVHAEMALAPGGRFDGGGGGGGGDTTRPTVASTAPTGGATGVAVGTSVTATFSEDVVGVSGTTFTLAPAAGGANVGATVSYDSATRVATLDPAADLTAGTQYTARLTTGIADGAGNALAATSWSFTTAGATSGGPVVTNRSPAPEARSVVVGTNVTATFDTAVQNVNTGTFTLVNAATGASVAAAVSYRATTRVATLNPSVNLAPDTRYRATLTTGIRASSGATLAGNESWEFVTGPAPRVTGRSPAVNATGVSRSANVTAKFSEQVLNVDTTTFTLTPAGGGPAVPAQVTRSGTTNTWILNPGQNLAGTTKYTASLASGITDAAGNPWSSPRGASPPAPDPGRHHFCLGSGERDGNEGHPAAGPRTTPAGRGSSRDGGRDAGRCARSAVGRLGRGGEPTTYLGHAYPSSAPPSADKPQSKLWFHDGAWWALMVGAGSTSVYVHELMPDHSWRNTGTLVDARQNNTGDALWSVLDSRLYVASRAPGSKLQVNSMSYDPGSRSWSVVPGFPVTVNSGGTSESATIDQDSLGNLWVTYTRASRVWVAHSTNSARTAWTSGFQPNVPDTVITKDDISALITFGDSIGVMWSDQGSDAFRFAVRDVSASDTAPWQVEDALAGTSLADDHINLKQLASDPQGRIFAAVKTSADEGTDPDAALVGVLTRTPGASGAPAQWTFDPAGTLAEGWTRPILMIDDTNDDLYFFATSDTGAGGDILYRRSALPSDPSQGISFTAVQKFVDAVPRVNNASGAKDPVTGDSGLVILATTHGQKKYVHAEMALVPGGMFDGGGGDTTAPTVTATSPAEGATGIAVGNDVTATFTEDVSGVSGSTFTLAPTAGGAAVGAAVAYDSATRVATLDPDADLGADTQYTATLTSGITDAAGNALAATSWNFTTVAASGGGGDTTPPAVSTTSPAAAATGVAVGVDVTATFTEDVTGVGGSTFTLAPTGGGAAVGAAVSYDSTTRVATLDTDADLAADTQYTATLTSGITDTAGNALAATSWSFTTAAATSTDGPTMTGRYPGINATGVSRTANVSAVFSEEVQNVTTTTFTLAPAGGGSPVVASVTLTSTTNKWRLDPAQPLAGATQYTVTIHGGQGGVTDLEGNPLASTVIWSFTTAA